MPFDFFKYDYILDGALHYPFVFDFKGINATLGGPSFIDVVLSGVSPLVLENAIQLNYLKLFGGTEQRNLPDNYIERQYIYMMDNSYLLTDIVPTYDCKVEMDFQTTTLPSASVYFLGGRTETFGGLFFVKTSADVFMVDAFGNTSGDRYTSSVSVQNNTRYKFTFNNKVASVESNGTTLLTNTFTTENANGAALCINGLNNNGTLTTSGIGIYLYSFKVWNAQGELVMGLVPAVQKGTVPVVGFYDTVSKTFKTATEGTFAAGGEAVPTPDTPMDVVSNNGVIKAKHQSGLPLGYTLLDSVVFDSTQVIDTGFTPDNDSRIESKCYRTGEDCWFYGASPSNPRITLYHSRTGTCRWGYQSRSNVGFAADTEYTIIEDKNGLNINGVDNPWTSGTADDFTCDRSLTIGNNNGSTGTRYFSGNLYYMKIYDDNVLVRDFVPCQNASNVVGLYDKVNGVFYTDAGLVAGNPVNDPVEIYTDGTVETIALNGGTATAEMLLKVGDYKDEQSILDGEVTRGVGIKVLNGTEEYSVQSINTYNIANIMGTIADKINGNENPILATHFVAQDTAIGVTQTEGILNSNTAGTVYFRVDVNKIPVTVSSAAVWKSWLAEQYAAGTPVIIIYPLATPTTESVMGQTLTASGNCTAEITQASINNLELEVGYRKQV